VNAETQEGAAYLGLGENKINEDQFETDPDCVEQGEVLPTRLAIFKGR